MWCYFAIYYLSSSNIYVNSELSVITISKKKWITCQLWKNLKAFACFTTDQFGLKQFFKIFPNLFNTEKFRRQTQRDCDLAFSRLNKLTIGFKNMHVIGKRTHVPFLSCWCKLYYFIHKSSLILQIRILHHVHLKHYFHQVRIFGFKESCLKAYVYNVRHVLHSYSNHCNLVVSSIWSWTMKHSRISD